MFNPRGRTLRNLIAIKVQRTCRGSVASTRVRDARRDLFCVAGGGEDVRSRARDHYYSRVDLAKFRGEDLLKSDNEATKA